MTSESPARASSLPIDLRNLDILRGLLAIYVVLGHARWLLWIGHDKWMAESHFVWEKVLAFASAGLRAGHEAVMVFFVLSGFFIHFRYARQLVANEQIRFNLTSFFRRRAHRLIAPYFLALLLTLLLDSIGGYLYPTIYSGHSGDPVLDTHYGRSNFSTPAVAPALLMLPSALGVNFGTNGPLWSLGFEVVYYLLYPLWLLSRRLGPGLAYVACPLCCVSLGVFLQSGFVASVLLNYPVWLAGAALAELLLKKPLPVPKTLVAAVGLMAFLATQIPLFDGVKLIFHVVGGMACVLVFATLISSQGRSKVRLCLEALGLRSYSIYIFHFPMLALMSAWAIGTNGERPVSGWLALTGAIVVLGLCCLLFELCERHFLHPRLKLQPAKPSA